VAATVSLLGGLFQINPVWLYGPYEPSAVSTAAQPDWYMGWLEGALRLMPAVRWELFGYRVPELVFPAVLFPGLTFLALYLWPAIDKRLTGDRAEHHLLDRARHHPARSALGAAVLAFYVVLFVAGSQDLIAQRLGVSIEAVTWALRALLVVVPCIAAAITVKVCHDLAAEDEREPEDEAADDEPAEPAEPEREATTASPPAR
jgi:ubiquinol-cytochrome c reductase cytochrome b subunit